jgi:hypothetical protein
MSVENLLWGAPRIHGELLKLGFAEPETIDTAGPNRRFAKYGAPRSMLLKAALSVDLCCGH